MSVQLTIGLYEGEITDVTTTWMISDEVACHFPLGEVYTYGRELQGFQWRVLQRGRKIEGRSKTYPALLPCEPEDVPEIVRMAALMHE